MVTILINSPETSFIDRIIALVRAERITILVKDGYLTHVEPLDLVVRERDVGASVSLIEIENDLLVDVCRVVAITSNVHAIDHRDRVLAFRFTSLYHLKHLFLSIDPEELILD